MPLLAKDSAGQDFDPIQSGVHQAVCYSVVDCGTQPNANTKFPPRRKVAITWEIPGERINIKGEVLPRAITSFYTLSLASKGLLRTMLESWRGRKFTQDELDGFDLENLIGVNCLLNVVHNKGDNGKIYANVASVSPLAKGMTKLAMENPAIFFALPENPTELIIPNNIPAWIKAKILASSEFAATSPGNSGPTDEQLSNQDGSAIADDSCPF